LIRLNERFAPLEWFYAADSRISEDGGAMQRYQVNRLRSVPNEVRARGEWLAAPKTPEKVKRKTLHNDFLVVI